MLQLVAPDEECAAQWADAFHTAITSLNRLTAIKEVDDEDRITSVKTVVGRMSLMEVSRLGEGAKNERAMELILCYSSLLLSQGGKMVANKDDPKNDVNWGNTRSATRSTVISSERMSRDSSDSETIFPSSLRKRDMMKSFITGKPASR